MDKALKTVLVVGGGFALWRYFGGIFSFLIVAFIILVVYVDSCDTSVSRDKEYAASYAAGLQAMVDRADRQDAEEKAAKAGVANNKVQVRAWLKDNRLPDIQILASYDMKGKWQPPCRTSLQQAASCQEYLDGDIYEWHNCEMAWFTWSLYEGQGIVAQLGLAESDDY